GSIALVVALVPWTEIPADSSPFATVLDRLGVPAAATILEVVVLVALLSAMNSAVYVCSRTLFALAGAGDASPALARVDAHGVPRTAVLACAGAAGAATVVAFVSPEGAFLVLLGTAGAISLPVYALVAVAQIRLRHRRAAAGEARPAVPMWLFPHLSWAVVVLIGAIAAGMALLPDFQAQLLLTAAVFLGLAAAYALRRRRAARRLDG
ncbi:MAG TPA: amino acid permease, partial [Pseudonocardia sp.]|nr:amino acid permease [Pseudonocardia sp.]